jgi:hypothetical protein
MKNIQKDERTTVYALYHNENKQLVNVYMGPGGGHQKFFSSPDAARTSNRNGVYMDSDVYSVVKLERRVTLQTLETDVKCSDGVQANIDARALRARACKESIEKVKSILGVSHPTAEQIADVAFIAMFEELTAKEDTPTS